MLQHLRNFIFDSKVIIDWPDFLPQVEQIMNSHVSQATGVALVDMVFVGQVNLNQGKLFPQPPYNNVEPMSEYMQRIIKKRKSSANCSSESERYRHVPFG